MFNINIISLLRQKPQAMAQIKGSSSYPDINGEVYFYQTKFGVIAAAIVSGLPKGTNRCHKPVLGFHIHEGSSCSGNSSDPFSDTMTHYNPEKCPHPYHAGDMPPLFCSNGFAFSAFLTDRFSVKEIVGKTVIIHSAPDDFTTQPSGNSGTKIACGEIKVI